MFVLASKRGCGWYGAGEPEGRRDKRPATAAGGAWWAHHPRGRRAVWRERAAVHAAGLAALERRFP